MRLKEGRPDGFHRLSALANHYAIALLQRTLLVGLSRFELLTPRLSSVCSNQLSYRPSSPLSRHAQRTSLQPIPSKLDRTCAQPAGISIDLSNVSRSSVRRVPGYPRGLTSRRTGSISRKEVIQPQVLLQLPCYDFTPITNHTLGACLPCGLAQRLLVQPAFVM